MTIAIRSIAFIGFGEAGGILGAELARRELTVSAYDVLLEAPAARQAMRSKMQAAGVRPGAGVREIVQDSQLVISAVTASESARVAQETAPHLRAGQFYLDINSVSPATKRASSECIEAGGASYVEAAVMAPVPPQRLAVPMLLGGAQAQALAEALRALGMNATAVSERIGVASAVKMCRSIIIKGLEAITLESLFAARCFGAEREVLASLERSYPQMGWAGDLPDYLVSRVAEHGRRRAAEMREVVRTLTDAGLTALMAAATAQRQDRLIDEMAEHGIEYRAGERFSWRELADQLKP
ncbi:MAG TPA: DUF1932 domain-containing protein [Steroidobacteraceae bacterium]|nr:DUF1932 domain-containing protein [Steroidobacteraceae bacterium]